MTPVTPTAPLTVLNVLFWLALSLWIGTLFAFGALVAPGVFAALQTREQAGAVVGRVLGRIHGFGLIAGLALLVISASQAALLAWSAAAIVRLAAVLLMVLLTIYNMTSVDRGVAAAKARMTRPIDEYDLESPEREEYNRWHRASTRAFGLTLVIGLALLVWAAAGK